MKILKTINSIKKQGDFSEKEIKLIEKAYLFAEKAHKGQSIGKIPFFNHPAHVGYFIAKCKQSGEAVSAGLLHDVVEDCKVKLPEIKSKFGERVAFYVDGMSYFRKKINGKMKKDYPGYYKKFFDYAKQDPVLAIIKAGDEMSRTRPQNAKRVIESLKKNGIWEDFQKMINERTKGVWIPFFSEIGFNKVVKKLNQRARFVKEVKIEIKLYNYISKKELSEIKTKIGKIKGMGSLRNS
jgi:(p)ppGpp synthase/HD superfamily hydrolase